MGALQAADCRGGGESRKRDSRCLRQDGQGAGGLEPGWQRADPGYEDGGNIGLGQERTTSRSRSEGGGGASHQQPLPVDKSPLSLPGFPAPPGNDPVATFRTAEPS